MRTAPPKFSSILPDDSTWQPLRFFSLHMQGTPLAVMNLPPIHHRKREIHINTFLAVIANTHTAIYVFVNRQHIPDTCTPKKIKYNILGHIGQKNASRKIEILTKETK